MSESRKREVAEALRDIQWLQEQPAWRRLTGLITSQVEARKRLLLRPIITSQDQAQHNVWVGEVTGLDFLLQAPEKAIAALLKEAP